MSVARRPDPVDVCIVGAGASGATAARALAKAGLKVVALDRGPWLQPDQFSGDELKIINREYLRPDPELSPRTVKYGDRDTVELNPFSNTPQMVGGGTVIWAGWFPRPQESDFKLRSLHGDIPGASLADWPITYDDLEPYLTKVEWEFGTAGIAGANKHEAHRSKGYPCPPQPVTSFGKAFYKGCAELGVGAFPLPMAQVTTEYNGRDPNSRSGFWNHYGDPSTTKSTTLTTFVPDALATGNFELRPDCYVREITVHADGRAKGVLYMDAEGREVEQEASIVIVGCGAIETARLLLMSKSNLFPDGLANSSGKVGHNATFHEYLLTVGLFDRELHDPLHGWTGPHVSGASMDFYETDESRGHILGSIITASQSGHPIDWILPGRPEWGQAAKDADRDFFNHSMIIGLILHDLPQDSNRVELDPDVTDAWHLPVARIVHTSHPNDIALGNWQVAKNAEILEAAGAIETRKVTMERCTGNTCHQHGTARMGTDPSTSVVNEWCRAHDVENLYILDASTFPTALGLNPTLTLMANAWRCADRIVEEARR